MFNKNQIINTIQRDASYLRSIHLKSIGLFGSAARAENTEKSDLDFLVEYDPGHKNWKNFNKMCDYIEEHFCQKYDLVTKEGLPPWMFENISKDIIYVQLHD